MLIPHTKSRLTKPSLDQNNFQPPYTPDENFSSVQRKIREIHSGPIPNLPTTDGSIRPLPNNCRVGIGKTFLLQNNENNQPDKILKAPAFTRKNGPPKTKEDNLRVAIPYEEISFRERIAYLIQKEAEILGVDLKVPPTRIVSISKEHNLHGLPNEEIIFSEHKFIQNTQTLHQCPKELQQDVLESTSSKTVDQIRKIALLDIQLGNTDRNLNNVLIDEETTFTPIDHGLSLSHNLKDRMSPFWLKCAATRHPLSESEKTYIEGISFERLKEKITKEMPGINPETLAVLDTTTGFLKAASSFNITPYQMGELMHKGKFESVSPVEAFNQAIKRRRIETPSSVALAPYLEICADSLTRSGDTESDSLTHIKGAAQKLANRELPDDYLSEKEKMLYKKFTEID